ncbi:MAG: radical SAM protein, partial [Clostridia bacterium]|nr:radical SAM protein [Clostridia bacterium]
DGVLPRIRFMTSHPKDLSDKLIETIAGSGSVCHHIHLPLQSGNDRILQLMNRHYTREDYLSLVGRIRTAIPDISLTTDLIVGFPTEEEAEFADTLAMVEACRFDSAFTFNYSPRKGTRAAEMEGQVPSEVMTDRIQRLIALQEEITQENYKRFLGKSGEVLTEGTSLRDPSMLTGKLSQGITVNFSAPEPVRDYIGRFVRVSIDSAGHNTLRGTMIP